MKSLKELQLTEENHPVDDNMDFRQRNALTKPTLSPYVAYQILKSYLGNPTAIFTMRTKRNGNGQ